MFVRGMYCELREPVREIRRIRVRRGEEDVGFVGLFEVEVEGFLDERVRRRLWYVRAKVRAPERAMSGVTGAVDAGCVVRRWVREERRVCWRVRNGR